MLNSGFKLAQERAHLLKVITALFVRLFSYDMQIIPKFSKPLLCHCFTDKWNSHYMVPVQPNVRKRNDTHEDVHAKELYLFGCSADIVQGCLNALKVGLLGNALKNSLARTSKSRCVGYTICLAQVGCQRGRRIRYQMKEHNVSFSTESSFDHFLSKELLPVI